MKFAVVVACCRMLLILSNGDLYPKSQQRRDVLHCDGDCGKRGGTLKLSSWTKRRDIEIVVVDKVEGHCDCCCGQREGTL